MNGAEFKHDPNEEEWVDPYPKKKRKIGWFTGIFLLLVAYVLSVGPAVRFLDSQSVFQTIYGPLDAFCSHNEAASHILNLYIDLWSPET